jgi:AcrR family transcriptional regulator
MLADTNVKATAPPRARLTSPERRAAIVAAAMQLFARNGFRGTTTREIAAAVGVSEPVLYQHFAAKKDLYTAIVDQMVADVGSEFEAITQKVNEATNPREFLSAVGVAVMDWYVTRGEHIRLLFFSALEGHELAEIWHGKATAQFLELVERGIADWQREGLLRETDPAIAGRAFIGMVAQYGLTTTVFQMPLPGLKREEALEHFVELFLAGLSGKTGEVQTA